MSRPATAKPGPEVLADLLLASVEADRVEETYILLAELVGESPVRRAHRVALSRLSNAVEAAAGADPAAGRSTNPAGHSEDVFELASRLRATSPARPGGQRGRP